MASKNLVLKDATWNGVESVDFPVSGGGTARYIETSDADATAADIASGKTAYVNGSLIVGTASGGGGGLEYESGIFTPAEDIARPVISFSNVHTNKPSLVLMSDVEETLAAADSAEYFAILNWFDCFGVALKASASIMNYARVQFGYKTSAGLTQGGYVINDYNGTSVTTALGYYLSNSSFTPYAGSDSRYFRSGRTYKWIAVWAPTS